MILAIQDQDGREVVVNVGRIEERKSPLLGGSRTMVEIFDDNGSAGTLDLNKQSVVLLPNG